MIGWPVTVGVVEVGVIDTHLAAATVSGRDACLHCTQGLAGHDDGYQCGLDWGRSSTIPIPLFAVNTHYLSLQHSDCFIPVSGTGQPVPETSSSFRY